jgi:hypothetical protein
MPTIRLARNATLLVAGVYSVALAQSDLVRHWGVPWPYKFDPTADLRGWRVAAAHVSSLADHFRTNSGQPFIIADSQRLAAALGFHLPRSSASAPPAVQTVPSVLPRDDFALWPRFDSSENAAAYTGANALYVSDNGRAEAPTALIRASFARVERLGAFDVIRGGHRVRRLTFFACYDYRGPPF